MSSELEPLDPVSETTGDNSPRTSTSRPSRNPKLVQNNGSVRAFLNQSAGRQLRNIVGGSKNTAIARNAKKSYEAGLKRKEQTIELMNVFVSDIALRNEIKRVVASAHTHQNKNKIQATLDIVPAAVVFADVSGFSTLAEFLHHGGQSQQQQDAQKKLKSGSAQDNVGEKVQDEVSRAHRGAEMLHEVLNNYFGEIMKRLTELGGDVIKLAGDACVIIWRADDEGESLSLACHSATYAIWNVVQSLSNYEHQGFKLSLHAGVGVGKLMNWFVGNTTRRFHVATGDPLDQSTVACDVAVAGQVSVSPEVYKRLSVMGKISASLSFEDRAHGYKLVTSIPGLPPTRFDWMDEDLGAGFSEKEAALKLYTPTPVLNQINDFARADLKLLRRISTLFLALDIKHKDPKWPTDIAFLEGMQEAVDVMQRVVADLEGYIKEFGVDDKGTILVVGFGVPPHAHGDDPYRAITAAIAMSDQLKKLGHACDIGVTTGDVFVGTVGNALRREFGLLGAYVNLSARFMCANKKLNIAGHQILCDENTYEATKAKFKFLLLPKIEVKGKKEPVAIFRPVEVIKKVKEKQQGVQRLSAKFSTTPEPFGRTNEVNHMRTCVTQLFSGDHPSTLMVEGTPGAGKSVLIFELRRICHFMNVPVLKIRCKPHNQNNPLLPWGHLMDQHLGFSALHNDKQKRNFLISLVGDKLGYNGTRGAALLAPILSPGFSLSLDAAVDEMEEGIKGAERLDLMWKLLHHLFGPKGYAQKSVFVIEDAHHLDDFSWELIRTISNNKLQKAFLCVGSRRVMDGAPGSQMFWAVRSESNLLVQIVTGVDIDTVGALVVKKCRELEMKDVDKCDETVSEFLHERTNGNPMFVLEWTNAMLSNGVLCNMERMVSFQHDVDYGETPLCPFGIQATFFAMNDQLTPIQQTTMHVCSVLGRSFTAGEVLAVFPSYAAQEMDEEEIVTAIETALESLEKAGFMRRRYLERTTSLLVRGSDPISGCEDLTDLEEFTFTSALIQDVIYKHIPYNERTQIHSRIADLYGVLEATEPGMYCAELAHHLTMAGKEAESREIVAKWEKRIANYITRMVVEVFGEMKTRSPSWLSIRVRLLPWIRGLTAFHDFWAAGGKVKMSKTAVIDNKERYQSAIRDPEMMDPIGRRKRISAVKEIMSQLLTAANLKEQFPIYSISEDDPDEPKEEEPMTEEMRALNALKSAAALKIQKVWRGHEQRTLVHDWQQELTQYEKKDAQKKMVGLQRINGLQSNKGSRSLAHAAVWKNSAVMIQSFWRMVSIKRKFTKSISTRNAPRIIDESKYLSIPQVVVSDNGESPPQSGSLSPGPMSLSIPKPRDTLKGLRLMMSPGGIAGRRLSTSNLGVSGNNTNGGSAGSSPSVTPRVGLRHTMSGNGIDGLEEALKNIESGGAVVPAEISPPPLSKKALSMYVKSPRDDPHASISAEAALKFSMRTGSSTSSSKSSSSSKGGARRANSLDNIDGAVMVTDATDDSKAWPPRPQNMAMTTADVEALIAHHPSILEDEILEVDSAYVNSPIAPPPDENPTVARKSSNTSLRGTDLSVIVSGAVPSRDGTPRSLGKLSGVGDSGETPADVDSVDPMMTQTSGLTLQGPMDTLENARVHSDVDEEEGKEDVEDLGEDDVGLDDEGREERFEEMERDGDEIEFEEDGEGERDGEGEGEGEGEDEEEGEGEGDYEDENDQDGADYDEEGEISTTIDGDGNVVPRPPKLPARTVRARTSTFREHGMPVTDQPKKKIFNQKLNWGTTERRSVFGGDTDAASATGSVRSQRTSQPARRAVIESNKIEWTGGDRTERAWNHRSEEDPSTARAMNEEGGGKPGRSSRVQIPSVPIRAIVGHVAPRVDTGLDPSRPRRRAEHHEETSEPQPRARPRPATIVPDPSTLPKPDNTKHEPEVVNRPPTQPKSGPRSQPSRPNRAQKPAEESAKNQLEFTAAVAAASASSTTPASAPVQHPTFLRRGSSRNLVTVPNPEKSESGDGQSESGGSASHRIRTRRTLSVAEIRAQTSSGSVSVPSTPLNATADLSKLNVRSKSSTVLPTPPLVPPESRRRHRKTMSVREILNGKLQGGQALPRQSSSITSNSHRRGVSSNARGSERERGDSEDEGSDATGDSHDPAAECGEGEWEGEEDEFDENMGSIDDGSDLGDIEHAASHVRGSSSIMSSRRSMVMDSLNESGGEECIDSECSEVEGRRRQSRISSVGSQTEDQNVSREEVSGHGSNEATYTGGTTSLGQKFVVLDESIDLTEPVSDEEVATTKGSIKLDMDTPTSPPELKKQPSNKANRSGSKRSLTAGVTLPAAEKSSTPRRSRRAHNHNLGIKIPEPVLPPSSSPGRAKEKKKKRETSSSSLQPSSSQSPDLPPSPTSQKQQQYFQQFLALQAQGLVPAMQALHQFSSFHLPTMQAQGSFLNAGGFLPPQPIFSPQVSMGFENQNFPAPLPYGKASDTASLAAISETEKDGTPTPSAVVAMNMELSANQQHSYMLQQQLMSLQQQQQNLFIQNASSANPLPPAQLYQQQQMIQNQQMMVMQQQQQVSARMQYLVHMTPRQTASAWGDNPPPVLPNLSHTNSPEFGPTPSVGGRSFTDQMNLQRRASVDSDITMELRTSTNKQATPNIPGAFIGPSSNLYLPMPQGNSTGTPPLAVTYPGTVRPHGNLFAPRYGTSSADSTVSQSLPVNSPPLSAANSQANSPQFSGGMGSGYMGSGGALIGYLGSGPGQQDGSLPPPTGGSSSYGPPPPIGGAYGPYMNPAAAQYVAGQNYSNSDRSSLPLINQSRPSTDRQTAPRNYSEFPTIPSRVVGTEYPAQSGGGSRSPRAPPLSHISELALQHSFNPQPSFGSPKQAFLQQVQDASKRVSSLISELSSLYSSLQNLGEEEARGFDAFPPPAPPHATSTGAPMPSPRRRRINTEGSKRHSLTAESVEDLNISPWVKRQFKNAEKWLSSDPPKPSEDEVQMFGEKLFYGGGEHDESVVMSLHAHVDNIASLQFRLEAVLAHRQMTPAERELSLSLRRSIKNEHVKLTLTLLSMRQRRMNEKRTTSNIQGPAAAQRYSTSPPTRQPKNR